jgi:hypothetical protein
MKRPVYQQIANTLHAIENCRKTDNKEWLAKHTQRLRDLVSEHMPRGSGFDNGTMLATLSTQDKLIFRTSYHHMDGAGMYDGWTEHTVTVTPSLAFDFDLKISGQDRNNIKEYIAEVFNGALREEIEQ